MHKIKNDSIKPNITTKDGVLAYAVALAGTLVIGMSLVFVPEGNAQTLLNYFITQLGFLIIPFLYLKSRNLPYLEAVPIKRKVKPIALLLVIPITIGAFLQNTILSVAFNWLLEAIGVTPNVNLPLTDNALNVTLAVLAVCVLPAISEEFLFRGIMLSSYRSKGAMGSAILTAIIFALSHFNPAQIMHQAVLGFVLAYLVIASDNIWYGVVLHLLNNLIALFIGDLIPSYNSLAVLNGTNLGILIGMCLIGMAILTASLYAFSKLSTVPELKVDNPFKVLSKKHAPLWYQAEKKLLDPLTVGFIVCMAVLGVLSTLASYLTI